MHLIKYKEGGYVNADSIDWLRFLDGGLIKFSLNSDFEYDFTVTKDYAEIFLNHLQAINSDFCNVQGDYIDFIKKEQGE